MTATDHQATPHAISYAPPSAAERQVAEQLTKTRHHRGPIDLSFDTAMDELPD